MERVKIKLKGLKSALKKWRKLGHNNDIKRKKKIVAEIEQLDKKDDEELLREDIRVRRIALLGELKALSEREITMMNQKSRFEWLEKRDTNSKFFHARMRWRLLRNEIKGVFINGEWQEEPHMVKVEIQKYFANKFLVQSGLT